MDKLKRLLHKGPNELSPEFQAKFARYFQIGLLVLVLLLTFARFVNFTKDFYAPGTTWEGEPYNDEGFYASNAIRAVLEGEWYNPIDFNQAIAIPGLQWFQYVFFSVMGVSVFTIRFVNALFMLGMFGMTYLIVRRFHAHWVALLAVFLLAMQHTNFAYARLALAEVPMGFWLCTSIYCAVSCRGKHAYLFAAGTALAYAMAFLTKTSAVFAVPLIGGIVIAQELDWKRIGLKFVICSAVFLGFVGGYFYLYARQYWVDVEFFFSLNAGVTTQTSIGGIVTHMFKAWHEFKLFDLGIYKLLPIGALLGLLFAPGLRRSPLFYIGAAWFLLYLFLYGYYGRFHSRFTLSLMPGITLLAASIIAEYWEMRHKAWRFTLTAAAGLAIIVWSGYSMTYNWRYLTYTKDSYREMAEEIYKTIQADPETNDIIMSHQALSIALYVPITPRMEKYSPIPLDERLREIRPSYMVNEGFFRIQPQERYYRNRETIEQYAHTEFIKAFDVYENWRGYPLVFYKLIPHDEPGPAAAETTTTAEDAQ